MMITLGIRGVRVLMFAFFLFARLLFSAYPHDLAYCSKCETLTPQNLTLIFKNSPEGSYCCHFLACYCLLWQTHALTFERHRF